MSRKKASKSLEAELFWPAGIKRPAENLAAAISLPDAAKLIPGKGGGHVHKSSISRWMRDKSKKFPVTRVCGLYQTTAEAIRWWLEEQYKPENQRPRRASDVPDRALAAEGL